METTTDMYALEEVTLGENFENVTSHNNTLPPAPTLSNAAIVKTVVLSIIALVSFGGNLATLISIQLRKRQTRSTIYIFIFQLALADVFVSIFCATGEAVWTFTVEWMADNITCKFIKYIQMFSLYLSTYVSVLIGVDRYIAIKYPIKSKEAQQLCHAQIVAAWLSSAIFSLPQLLVFSVQPGPFREEFYQCVTYGSYTMPWQEQLYTTATLLLMFVIPLLVILTTYIAMFRVISNSVSTFESKDESAIMPVRASTSVINRVKRLRMAKNKSLILTIVIVLTFVICWTPYYVMMIVFIFLDPDDYFSDQLKEGVFFFGLSNSMLNPLIYGAFHLRRKRPNYNTRYSNDKSSRNMSRHRMSFNHTIVTTTGGGSLCCKTHFKEQIVNRQNISENKYSENHIEEENSNCQIGSNFANIEKIESAQTTV